MALQFSDRANVRPVIITLGSKKTKDLRRVVFGGTKPVELKRSKGKPKKVVPLAKSADMKEYFERCNSDYNKAIFVEDKKGGSVAT